MKGGTLVEERTLRSIVEVESEVRPTGIHTVCVDLDNLGSPFVSSTILSSGTMKEISFGAKIDERRVVVVSVEYFYTFILQTKVRVHIQPVVRIFMIKISFSSTTLKLCQNFK